MERWAYDSQFEIEEITEVKEDENYWDLKLGSSMCFFVAKKDCANPPRVGRARFFGRGFGFNVRGIVMESTADDLGCLVFYRTEAEEEARHHAQVEENKAQKRRDFERDREKLDRDYVNLPVCFQKRLDRFRANCPEFRWEFEPYEMNVCVEAVKIAKALKTRAAIAEWYKLPPEEQRKVVEYDEGHSGNSFGQAVRLACAYADEAYEYVALSHGALTPLVGCEACGCTHEEA